MFALHCSGNLQEEHSVTDENARWIVIQPGGWGVWSWAGVSGVEHERRAREVSQRWPPPPRLLHVPIACTTRLLVQRKRKQGFMQEAEGSDGIAANFEARKPA